MVGLVSTLVILAMLVVVLIKIHARRHPPIPFDTSNAHNHHTISSNRTTSGGAGPRNNSFNTNSIQKINTSHPGERQSFRTTRLNATASSLSPASDDPDLIPLQTSTKNLQLGTSNSSDDPDLIPLQTS